MQKKDENKFHMEAINHLLNLGATFDRFTDNAIKANYQGATFTFHDLARGSEVETFSIPCKAQDGKNANFVSSYSRAESLEAFKIHIGSLYGTVYRFGYAGLRNGEIVFRDGFKEFLAAKYSARQNRRELRNVRLYVITTAKQCIYLT